MFGTLAHLSAYTMVVFFFIAMYVHVKTLVFVVVELLKIFVV